MKKLLLLCISVCAFHTYAQEYPRKEINIRNFIQDIVGNPDGGVNEDLFESLYQNYLNPIDLNKVTREQLASVYILSEKQLNSFFNYRQKAGNLLSIYELQSISDFDLRTIYKLIPFVAVKPDGLSFGTLTDGFGGSNQYLLLRYAQILETKKGFTDPTSTSKVRYEGSPFKLYARYKMFSQKDFSLGFTLEKDEGEAN
jgi:Helix-hairpin-helix motif